MKRHLALSAALLLASLTASCGLKGGLEKPAPLWGENAKRQYEEQKAAEAAAKAAKKSRSAISIPVENTNPAAAAAAAPAEDMTATTDEKAEDAVSDAPSAADPYDGKGAPPPVEDNTGSQPKTAF